MLVLMSISGYVQISSNLPWEYLKALGHLMRQINIIFNQFTLLSKVLEIKINHKAFGRVFHHLSQLCYEVIFSHRSGKPPKF